eukprot:6942807-Karenia_brevis.AAC.1
MCSSCSGHRRKVSPPSFETSKSRQDNLVYRKEVWHEAPAEKPPQASQTSSLPTSSRGAVVAVMPSL